MVILDSNHKLKTPQLIDKFVCAEIPNIKTHPILHQIISKNMIHGPCGAKNPKSSCMENNICRKNFPKNFCQQTNTNINSFAEYRRRECEPIQLRNHLIDNTWVVPYNPYLSLKYNCHINVEVASSIKCVKYLFKYIYKGYDCADIRLKQTNYNNDEQIYQHNEIDQYISTRYISAPESVHRLFEFPMRSRSHAVIRLALHLPLEQKILFTPGNEKSILNKNNNTTLTAWFDLNKHNITARQYTYVEIPEHFVYNSTNKIWETRKKGKLFLINYIFN